MAGRRARGLLDAEMDDGDTLGLSHSLNAMATRTEGEEDIEDEEEEEEEEEENDGSGDEEEEGDEEDVQRNKENHPTENVSGTARVNYLLAFKYLEETYTSAQTLFEMKPDFDLLGYILSLPMSCMDRPPVDTADGRRSREVRFPAEYHVTVLMASMERAPCGDHLPWVGMIDPAECTSVDQVDLQKLRSGGYTIWILGAGHCREARSRLMVKHPQVDFYKRNVYYVYVGLTVEESLLIGHEHNNAAGYHKKLTFVQRMRCWRDVFERLGCEKTNEAKKPCLEALGIPTFSWNYIGPLDLQLQICMKGPEVWGLLSDIFTLWEQAKIKAVKMKKGVEVKSGVLSLDEMNNKFTLLKIRQRTVTAFVKGVGADSWEAAKKEFPVHTQEAMLSQYYGLYERNVKETPIAMQLYIAKALNYKDKLRLSQQEEQTAATQDPEGLLTNWTAFEGEGYKGTVKVAHCDMLQLPEKVQDRLPFTLCIMDFPCGYNAEDSMDDEEPFRKPQIEASIASFKKITCAPYWVIAGFCSSNMLTDVKSTFSSACNCGVEEGIWVAPNVSTSARLKLTNCWQHCIIGFHSESGCREPIQFQFIDSDTRMTCWNHNAVVRKYTFAANNEILCPYQKPISLYEWLIKKFSDPNDSYIVDAFSGSGTGAFATLLSKRHVLVVENDLRCVRGIRARLVGRGFVETAAKEIDTRGRTVAEGWWHA
ncbi:hypothetical protein CBR_g44364 [Chara braunii]|uniref:DNA methylase N-4/N-6 domain-containing protein n=1 Tax=Chara braunii TaxID=69332 RepID=A0A388LX61_CHABU|nr:hypothetical protein CBR_g44364 [Chara braunii]|eukprot:GBG86908.1 hypothetical protein CBR_g44364 [Chara braunii]